MIVGVAAGTRSVVAGMAAVAAAGAAIAGTYAVVADAPTVAGTSADDLAVAHVEVVGIETVAGAGTVQAPCHR